jgi:hypothetical protein
MGQRQKEGLTSWFPAVRAITLTLFAIRKMDVSGSQSAVYAVVMDKASILSAPVRLGPFDEGSIWPAIVAVLLVLAAIQSFVLWTPKQRLVPGILIVGGSSKDEVRASRSRFVQDSRSMVLEGCEKVSGSRAM